MKNNHTIRLRFLIERGHDHHAAYCLEFGIAVQGSSASDVRKRMQLAIDDYIARINEMLSEGDQQGARLLLLRRTASLSLYVQFYLNAVRSCLFQTDRHCTWQEYRQNPLAGITI